MAPRTATLVVECVGRLGIGGAPIAASIDDTPVFLAWDQPQHFELAPGRHGFRIRHEPVRWPFGANPVARSLQCNAGFRYTVRYIPRAAPFLPAKLELVVDRQP
jgi:hypothetical protein